MRQIILMKMMAGLFLISAIGCVDNQRDLSGYSARNLPKDQYFDFSTTQNVALDIDYCFGDKKYNILFDVYDQYPLELIEKGNIGDENYEASWEKKNIEPLYSAAPDEKGKFSGEMSIPIDITTVWLSSEYLGVATPVELTIGADRKITFNQNAYLAEKRQQASAKTRGITGNNYNYLADWHLLPGADWNAFGRPNNLSDVMNIPPADVLYNIKYVFRKSGREYITHNYPHFFDESKPMSSDIPVVKETEISLVFVHSSAAWYNTVGYYTYKTGTKPTKENIRKTIVYPNVSPTHKPAGYGALVCGEEVKLKYRDEAGNFHDKFPPNVTVGWCLQGMGFMHKTPTPTGDIVTGMGTRYSTRHLNNDGKQRTVSLRDATTNKIVAIGFEDNIDLDYADAIFYVQTTEEGAISPELPELPVDPKPLPDNYTITYSGTLAFEDLWPSAGDYDMNDVIIKYTSKVHKMVLDNRVYQIEDKFTMQHCGGRLQNGFGYQLHKLANSDINKVTITNHKGEIIEGSKFMDKLTNLESEQSHPTILLFDNTQIFKDNADKTQNEFNVTIKLNGADIKDIVPPYNPFIFAESDKMRGKEVHFINYPPTDKADMSLLGTGKDISRPSEQLYYTSIDLMPFAINIPSTGNELEILEKVENERSRIDVLFPKFASWAKSNGTKDKDWYKYPSKN